MLVFAAVRANKFTGFKPILYSASYLTKKLTGCSFFNDQTNVTLRGKANFVSGEFNDLAVKIFCQGRQNLADYTKK